VKSLTAWEWASAPPAGVPITAIDDAVVEMERNGIRLDKEFLKVGEYAAKHDQHTERLALRHWARDAGWAEVDGVFADGPKSRPVSWRDRVDSIWTSPQKLQVFLHSPLGLNLPPSPFWKKGKVRGVEGWTGELEAEDGDVKTDATALEYLAGAHPEHRAGINRLLNLRKVSSALKYFVKLPLFEGPDGLVHPTFGAAGDADDRVGALTGRQACKNPEFHQLPRDPRKDRYRVRKGVVAGPGEILVVVDYSALEVVILAHILLVLFNDDQLAQMIRPGAPDIHSVNAIRVFRDVLGHHKEFAGVDQWMLDHPKAGVKEFPDKFVRLARDLIKAIWYGLQYGKGEYGFGNTLFDANGDPIGEPTAKKMIDGIMAAIPALKLYQDWVMAYITKHGGICDIGGRWCDLRDLVNGDKWMKARAWRRALNFPMQASGAVIVGAAMYMCVMDPLLQRLGFKLIISVHDELILRGPEKNGPEALARTKWIMQNAYPLRVPLQVSGDLGYTWEDAK
jgi:DNA polymerase-1